MRRLASFVALLACSCSWTFVRPAQTGATPPTAGQSCTRSQALPLADTVLGFIVSGGLIGVGARGIREPGVHWLDELGRTLGAVGVGLGVLSALLFGGSAWHGFSATAKCRSAGSEASGGLWERCNPAGAGTSRCLPGLSCESGHCVRRQ